MRLNNLNDPSCPQCVKKELSRPQKATDRQGCGIKTINRPEEAGCRRWKRLITPAVEMYRCGPCAMLLLDVPKSHDIRSVQQFLHWPLQNCEQQQQQFITTQSLQYINTRCWISLSEQLLLELYSFPTSAVRCFLDCQHSILAHSIQIFHSTAEFCKAARA